MNQLTTFFQNIIGKSPLTSALLIVSMLLSSCVDDELTKFTPTEFPEGETELTMTLTFESVAEKVGGESRALGGHAMKDLDDLCLIAFDKEGNLMTGFPIDITQAGNSLTIDSVPREPADAANGILAEEYTKRATFTAKVPYGQYYLYAVANMGTRDKTTGQLTKTSWTALTEEGELKDATANRTTFLNYATEWDLQNPLNNFEMLGFFSNNKTATAPRTGELTNDVTVTVDSPAANLHCWLRRACAKVTIAFDGSELRENIHIYIRRATIHNIPQKCKIGKPNEALDESEVHTFKDSDYDPTTGADAIVYGEGADHSKWPRVSKGAPTLKINNQEVDFHAETAQSLFLYENMKGTSEKDKDNKLQRPGPDGLVIGSTDVEDNIKGGSYIEVEGYYEYSSAGEVSHGPIIYRFMLGDNTTDNFDVERNHHLQLTLKFRGDGNDVDWHIEYRHKGEFEYKDPYYVSYLYNHESTIHFRYTPPEKKKVVRLTAEIVANNWWPDDLSAGCNTAAVQEQSPIDPGLWTGDVLNDPSIKYGEGKKYTIEELRAANCSQAEIDSLNGKTKYLGNGWLSLWETSDMNITYEQTSRHGTYDSNTWASFEDNKYMNDRYFYGVTPNSKGEKRNRGYREYYFDADGFSSKSDTTNHDRNEYKVEPVDPARQDGSLRFSIPVFTRAKNLVKQTAYSGNNMYEGSTRTAIVKLSVYLEGETTPRTQLIRVKQVSRVVNPKGIYRRFGNNENFNVTLMELENAVSTNYIPIESDGPWLAEVIGEDHFVSINGRSVVKGSTGSPVKFNVVFNRLNHNSTEPHNAIIRVRYHNYSCVHLIFVRQGYSSQRLHSNGAEWYATNMVADGTDALDPRDEGSMFKYGNLSNAIDVKSNQGFGFRHNLMTPESFTIEDPLYMAQADRSEPSDENLTTWDAFNGNRAAGFTNNVAKINDFTQLYSTKNVHHAFGVLYADGATSVQTTVEGAFGYYRHDTSADRKKRGMRGVFFYYWDGNYNAKDYNTRNVFFPIGMSGFGHRRSFYKYTDANNHTTESWKSGTLRYSAGRDGEMPGSAVPWQPQFFDLYRRPGAIYWAQQYQNAIDVTGTSMSEAIALDINYYTYDVNLIGRNNLQKHSQWSACTDDNHLDACFLRRVGPANEPE